MLLSAKKVGRKSCRGKEFTILLWVQEHYRR